MREFIQRAPDDQEQKPIHNNETQNDSSSIKMNAGKEEPKMDDFNQSIQMGTAKDAVIKKTYFAIVDKGVSHYMEAIQYLVNTYNLDTSYAIMSYNPKITGAYAITGGNVGDATIPVEFAPPCFSKSQDFGTICRAVAHELIHTK